MFDLLLLPAIKRLRNSFFSNSDPSEENMPENHGWENHASEKWLAISLLPFFIYNLFVTYVSTYGGVTSFAKMKP